MVPPLLRTDYRIISILNKAAKVLKFDAPILNVDKMESTKGEGIMGVVYRASVSLFKGDKVNIVLKQAPDENIHREQALTELAYKNEIHFYSKAVPQLRQFEQEHGITESGVQVPEYITSNDKPGDELVALKDLTDQGYVLKDKHEVLDENHLNLIFKNYGRFHATSFCLKTKKPEQFQELVQPFQNIWEKNLSTDFFVQSYRQLVETTARVLNPVTYSHIHEKLKPYYESPESLRKIFLDSVKYKEDYGCLLHGDCWSNNMMFRYNKSTGMVEALKFLDFQLAGFGSPVHDLSYFLHIGASQIHFGHWETFLNVYYTSFTDTVKRYNESAEKLLPKEKLIEDWKKYSKSSMLLSMLLLKLKYLSQEDTVQLIKKFKQPPSSHRNLGFTELSYDKSLFVIKMKNIFQHMYAINGL